MYTHECTCCCVTRSQHLKWSDVFQDSFSVVFFGTTLQNVFGARRLSAQQSRRRPFRFELGLRSWLKTVPPKVPQARAPRGQQTKQRTKSQDRSLLAYCGGLPVRVLLLRQSLLRGTMKSCECTHVSAPAQGGFQRPTELSAVMAELPTKICSHVISNTSQRVTLDATPRPFPGTWHGFYLVNSSFSNMAQTSPNDKGLLWWGFRA